MSESEFDDFDIGPQADEGADPYEHEWQDEDISDIEEHTYGDLYVEEDLADEDESDYEDVYDDFVDEDVRGDWDDDWDGDDWDEDE